MNKITAFSRPYRTAGVLKALRDTGLCHEGAAGTGCHHIAVSLIQFEKGPDAARSMVLATLMTDIRLSPVSRLVIAAITGLSMISCAIVYERTYEYNEGWRKAKIAEIDFGREIAMQSSRDCRKEMPPEAVQLGRFAVVQFEGAAGHQYRIAPLPKQSTLQPGDLVYANIVDCARPLILR